MPTRLSWFLFYCLVAVVCALIFIFSESFPAIVAANFDMSGISSGQTHSGSYRNFMIGPVLFLAALHTIVFWYIGKLPASLINLPNKVVWFSLDIANQRCATSPTGESRWAASRCCFLHRGTPP
jgi:hypothetical protein